MSTVLITPGAHFGDAVAQNGYGFEYLGKQYVFTFRLQEDILISPPDDRHFRCMQSTDGGVTWAELSAGSAPVWPGTTGSAINNNFPVAFTVALDGSKAILLWVNAEKSPISEFNWINFTISKAVFDLGTSSWGTATTTAAPFFGMMDALDQPSTTTHSNRTSIYLIVRGPNNYLVYVPGAQSGTGTHLRANATVVTYDGSTFGSPMPIPGQASGKWYMPCGSVFDSVSGNTHFLVAGGIPAGGQPNIYHVAMDSGNSYGSVSTVIDSSTSPGDINASTITGPDGVSQPIIYLDGTTRKVAFVSSVFSTSPFPIFVRFFSATETLNPTFTHSDISTDQTIAPLDIPHFGVHSEMFSLATNGTTLIVTWINFVDSSLPSDIYSSTSPATGTLTWSTPVAVIPTPAAVPIVGGGTSPYVNIQGLAFPMTGGFGVVGIAQQFGNVPPYIVTQFAPVTAPGPPPVGDGCTFDFTVRVTDSLGNTATVACSIYKKIGIICNSPPSGMLGNAYSHTLTATGAPAGSTFSISTGALPPGLTLNPTTAVISGTPTLAGTFAFVASVNPPTGGCGGNFVACSIPIGYGTLATSCGSPPTYTVNVPGSIYRPPVVMGSIGLPPVYDMNDTLVWTFPVVLPPGFHWDEDPSSPTFGYMVGTPTTAGTFDFTYTVTAPDGQSVTNSCPITVAPPATGSGPSSTAACSITIAPASGGGGGTPCPDNTIGGPG